MVADRSTAGNKPPGVWTVHDVAWFLRVSESTIRKRVAAGTIPCHRVGRQIRFYEAEIRDWLLDQPNTEKENES